MGEKIIMNNTSNSETLIGIEPEFITQIRFQAKQSFENIGIPDSHQEDWKYTPIQRFLPNTEINTEWVNEIDENTILQNNPFPDLDSVLVVMENGRFRMDLSRMDDQESIRIMPIESSFNEESFKTGFNSMGKERKDFFSQLNTSDFDRGIYIHLKKGTQFTKPIHILHVYSGIENTIQNTRNLVILDAQSSLTLLESYISLQSEKEVDIFNNDLTEYYLDKDSKLETIRFQSMGRKTRIINTQLALTRKHSHFKSHTYSLSGKLIRNNLQINLSESESEAHLYGFYSIHDQELMDNHTLVKHLMPYCQSNELYKGVLEGKSIGVFNGRVEVSQDAQKTNAYQQNQTILLSPESTMNSKPELEIFADDVKCSHGSTLGQLDKAALFYLQSRGISQKTAQKIMINAFAFSLLSEISNEKIAELLAEKIHNLNS